MKSASSLGMVFSALFVVLDWIRKDLLDILGIAFLVFLNLRVGMMYHKAMITSVAVGITFEHYL